MVNTRVLTLGGKTKSARANSVNKRYEDPMCFVNCIKMLPTIAAVIVNDVKWHVDVLKLRVIQESSYRRDLTIRILWSAIES